MPKKTRRVSVTRTAEGIRRWWLSPDVESTQETLSLALEWMRRSGVIEVTTAADGRQRFSLSGTREQLEALLRKLGGDEIVSE